jgi:hypothetical protein
VLSDAGKMQIKASPAKAITAKQHVGAEGQGLDVASGEMHLLHDRRLAVLGVLREIQVGEGLQHRVDVDGLCVPACVGCETVG